MNIGEFEKLSKKELRHMADVCFKKAERGAGELDAGYLLQAQFYVAELERRADSWVSIRDFILEIVVIAMIGWEIHMGYQQETQQTQQFEKQQTVLGALNTSSSATAKSLIAVDGVLEKMNLSLQKQVELFYNVELNVIYNESSKRLIAINNGRANVTVWAHGVGEKYQMTPLPKAMIVTPSGGTYEMPITDEGIKSIAASLPKGQERDMTFTLFVKNDKQEKFTVAGAFVATWNGDALTFNTKLNETIPGWRQ